VFVFSQVDGGIGPLGLVGPWIGYRVLKKKKVFVFLGFQEKGYGSEKLLACN